MTARSHHTGLAVIAVFKVVKGLLLLLLGLGLLKLVHAEIATLFSLLIEALHLNADSRLIHALVLKVDALQPHSVLLAGLSLNVWQVSVSIRRPSHVLGVAPVSAGYAVSIG